MATGNRVRRERGFSLIELMIAMVATLIISGAVMQLVGAGKGAFRRQPELSDRQQNIRMAMSMIQQDVVERRPQHAGLHTGVHQQPEQPRAAGPNGHVGHQDGRARGHLHDPARRVSVALVPGERRHHEDAPGVLRRSRRSSACGTPPTSRWASPAASATAGTRASGDSHVNFPGGQNPLNPIGGTGNFDPTYMGLVSVMHYRSSWTRDGTPNLWRSAYGGYDVSGQSTWQLVARGIEDLQVQYRNRVGWQNAPGTSPGRTPPLPTARTTTRSSARCGSPSPRARWRTTSRARRPRSPVRRPFAAR